MKTATQAPPYASTDRTLFQSTPPVKAATRDRQSRQCHLIISIHAAREGGDVADGVPATFDDISIHAAREGGDYCPECSRTWYDRFQSTPPVKAATKTSFGTRKPHNISIHAAREGGDIVYQSLDKQQRIFQSTPPVKAATVLENIGLDVNQNFNPRRP